MEKMDAPVLIWLSGLLFAAIHSGMATERVKCWVCAAGFSPQRYRLVYSLLATLLTVAWLGFVHLLPDAPLYRVDGWLNLLLLAMQLAGLLITLLSFRAFDARMFLGLAPMPEGSDPFHEQGIYRFVRHPMYSGVMLALLASPVQTINSVNLVVVICLYFVLGARLEESRMLAAHPAYDDYRRRVPAFIPGIGKGRRHA